MLTSVAPPFEIDTKKMIKTFLLFIVGLIRALALGVYLTRVAVLCVLDGQDERISEIKRNTKLCPARTTCQQRLDSDSSIATCDVDIEAFPNHPPPTSFY